MSSVLALPLILTHKLLIQPQYSSKYSRWSWTEGNTLFSCSLSVLPKEPLSSHSSTPVIGAILPHARCQEDHSPAGVHSLLLLFYIPHATCFCLKAFKLCPWWSRLTGRNGWNSFMQHFRFSLADLQSLSRLWAALAGAGIKLVGVEWIEDSLSQQLQFMPFLPAWQACDQRCRWVPIRFDQPRSSAWVPRSSQTTGTGPLTFADLPDSPGPFKALPFDRKRTDEKAASTSVPQRHSQGSVISLVLLRLLLAVSLMHKWNSSSR